MKAFVGHSFDEKDEVLVDKIISFLSQRDVQCESGLKTQNKSVSEKVRQRIDRNDFFIGIFTVDRVIGEIPSFIQRIKRKSYIPEFTTSNWVIQESGYAIGKDKGIIFLVEKGIYKFPELQGDAEVIYFTRDKAGLNEALLKLLDTCQNIMSGKKAAYKSQTSAAKPEEKKKEDDAEDTGREDKLAWGELLGAHKAGNITEAKKIYNERIRSELNEKMIESWDAVIARWEYCAGDATALSKLEKMAEKENSRDIFWQVGICYEFANKYKEASVKFTKCLQLSKDISEKVDAIIRIAECYSAEKKPDSAINILIDALNDSSFKNYFNEIYPALIDIAKEKEDDYLYTMFSEKALDINPVDARLRFNLGFKYGNIDKPDLAVHHYKQLLKVEEDPMGFNNIGVEYSNLNIKTKSISYFKKAVEKKNALAHSNLANKYTEEGFIEEANSLLKKADELSREDREVHPNVGYSKNKLKDLKEEEEKKEKEILALAEQKQKYKVKHADAYCLKPVEGKEIKISRIWRIKDTWSVQFTFDKKKNTFLGYAQTEREDITASRWLGSLLAGSQGLGASSAEKNKVYKVRKLEIKGEIKNFSGNYTITITEEKNDAPSYENPEEIYYANGLLILNDNLTTIDVMEEDNKKQCHFEQWNKQ